MVPAANLGDAKLLQRFAKGDAGGFEMLYVRHKDPLYRYLVRGCNNQNTAAKLFQDIWLKVIDARGRSKTTAPFGTYLFAMAHQQLVDHYRRKRVTPVMSPQASAPDAPQPDAQHGDQQQPERIKAAISTLPFDQRETILLAEEGDFSLDQIAVITDVDRETVKSRLRHALAKLREVLPHE